MSRAQRILAVIVGLITGVLLMESYGAMVDAARAGGRAIPELWPLGTEALALAMEVSVLEAKRLGHRAVLRLSWLLLVASVALSTLLQVAVAPPPWSATDRRGDPGVAAGQLRGAQPALPHPGLDPGHRPSDRRRPVADGRAQQARARPGRLCRPGGRRPARHRRPAGRGRRHQRQLRPRLLADFQADPTLTASQGNGQRPGVEVGER
jgi:hypothetical protein